MTFPETLRELARLRPEKFKYSEFHEEIINEAYLTDAQGMIHWIIVDLNDGTVIAYQDDFDSILAAIGWEYEIRIGTVIKDDWFSHAWRVGNRVKLEKDGYARAGFSPTKLEAAQAAVTAVVEELKKGEKGCRKD